MLLTQPSTTSTGWVQILLTTIGLLGGTGGIAAIVTVLFQRRKLRADTADVLTDTALTLVEPLKQRVRELESDAQGAQQTMRHLRAELEHSRDAVRDMATIMRRWRAEILAPDADLEHLREMVRSVPVVHPPANGHSYPG